MTDKDVMALLMGNSALNKARAVFASEVARIDRAGMRPCDRPSPIEMRRMEFEAVKKIALELGVKL